MQRWDAVVVGGGVGGLVAAFELAEQGARVLVLEARATPGGAVGRHWVGGLTLDSGAESYATRGGSVDALADRLGLAGQVVRPEPVGAWAYLEGGPVPLPRAGVLGIPASAWAPDVRRAIGVLGSLRAGADRLLPAGAGAGSTTLGGLVRARLGRRVLDRLVRPVVAGVHAADPDDVDADAVAPGLRAALAEHGSLGAAVASLRALSPAGSAVAGLRGGMHTLVDALAAAIAERGGQVRTRTAVDAVIRSGSGSGFLVTAGPDVVRASALVVATAAPGLLAAVAAGLGPVRLDLGSDTALVTLVVDAPALDAAPRGTGVLVAPGTTAVRAKALTHGTAKWGWLAEAAGPGRHVLRLSYDGAVAAQVGRFRDVDALGDQALRDAGTLLGVPLTRSHLVDRAVVRTSRALPRPSSRHREAVERVRAAAGAVPGLAVTGAWVAGNGLASVVPDAARAAAALARDERPGGPDRFLPAEGTVPAEGTAPAEEPVPAEGSGPRGGGVG